MGMKEVLKKEMNNSIKIINENTNKQRTKMNKIVQGLVVESESIKKRNLEREKLGKE